MQFKVQLVTLAANGQDDAVIDLAVFDKACERVEQLGLTLAEAKELLQTTQRALLQQQTTAFLHAHAACPTCGKENVKGLV